jgi:GPI ethanolamine phosphate transferase 1
VNVNLKDRGVNMKFIVVSAIIVHILFLLSVFYIYFQSIIVKDLQPLKELYDAPAKRLVLIVSDGLRAQSFFDNNCNRTPFLKNILLTKGMVGVSHTHLPTESRPGHVALIAGVYEDPSSIFKGWKENPVEFDSIFNRSKITYAWGSPDIVSMFKKGAKEGRVKTDVYDSMDESFSGSAATHLLDKWVFDRVQNFLTNPVVLESLKEQDKLVLFLHLLGMDTSGHVHKPHSDIFSENLKYVDAGIAEIVKLIDDSFDDNKTAYIFTSDHGMTNRGKENLNEIFLFNKLTHMF